MSKVSAQNLITCISLALLTLGAIASLMVAPPARLQPNSNSEAKGQIGGVPRSAVSNESTDSEQAGEAVTLTGQVIISGTVPPREELPINKDTDYLGTSFVDPSLVIDHQSKGLRNAVVWIDRLNYPSDPFKPDQQQAESHAVQIEIRRGVFHPHVAVAQVGDRLTIDSSDPIGHNPKLDWRVRAPFGQTVLGLPLHYSLPTSEPLPVQVSCTVHSHMSSWLVVAAHRMVAVTNHEGRYTIASVPAGKHKLTYWHENLGIFESRMIEVGKDQRQTVVIESDRFKQ